MARKTKAEIEAVTKKVQKEAANGMTQAALVSANAIGAIHARTHFGDGIKGININEAALRLLDQLADVHKGNLAEVEETLFCQAKALDNLFLNLITKASNADYVQSMDVYARLALKAQNQSRATLATLADIKNPRKTVFVKQQNQAINQQVNNSEIPKNSDSPANEVLEHIDGQRLDFGAETAAIGANPELATMGKINGAEDRGWQASRQDERQKARRAVCSGSGD